LNRTVVFIHGAWLASNCWDPFRQYFEDRGYSTLAPEWPFKDMPVAEMRAHPPEELKGLGVQAIVDHYDGIIRALPEPPILIGHSFGGLFVQQLLDRGLGAAGIAISPAPPEGVLPLDWNVLRSGAGVFFTWMGWDKIVTMTFEEFQFGFANGLPEAVQRAAYDSYIVPETGRIYFQLGFAALDPHHATRVNFHNATRSPLLLIGAEKDHTVPAHLVQTNYRKYEVSSAQTDFREFPERVHWIVQQEGWQEVAGYCTDWLDMLVPAEMAADSGA
jgi:pimeloyl-ACP methyl ester carboxylesterase